MNNFRRIAPTPAEPPTRGHEGLCGKLWIEPVRRQYGGVAPSSSFSGGCICSNSRFDLDRFDRALVPAMQTHTVNVLDANGNPAMRIGGHGISIGGRDTGHWVRGNAIRDNAKAGIFFREGDLAMAGSRNRIEGNVIERNCRKQGSAEIEIQGEARDVHILKNTIRPAAREGKQVSGILVGHKAGRILIFGNKIEGDKVTPIENRAPDDAVATQPPAKLLPVGPEAAPKTGAAHLGGDVR